jgi:MFS family permease
MEALEGQTKEAAAMPEAKRRRSLRYSIWDGAFYAAMVGFAETYFVPLMLALGANGFQVGVFTAAPQVLVAFSQFASISLVENYRKRKRIVVGGVLLQAAALGFLLYKIMSGGLPPWKMIAVCSIYFAANGLVLPAWNSLIGDLTTSKDRGTYFGRKNSISGPISFGALVAGGLVLQHFHGHNHAMAGFSIILAAALASRLGSAYSLFRHFDVPYKKVKDSYFTFVQFLRRSPKSNFAHFVFFQGLINFAVQMAAPFFAVYMLRDLKFSYIEYTIAQGTFQIVQFMMMRQWGPLADRFGNRIIIRITGLLLPILPILWLLSKNLYVIIFIQIISGTTWAGWLLASANFVFDAVTPPKRARCAAYLNFFNSAGIFFGALIGGYLSIHSVKYIDTGAVRITFFSALEFIFIISGILRMIFVFSFMPAIHEVRPVEKTRMKNLFLMLAHVRPLTGSQYEPYTGRSTEKKAEND